MWFTWDRESKEMAKSEKIMFESVRGCLQVFEEGADARRSACVEQRLHGSQLTLPRREV